MLKNRIIPILLLKDGRMIKTIQFNTFRDVGDPITTARIFNAQRADELIFLDISASYENRKTLLDIVRASAEECFMPVAVGGGIKNIEEIRLLLQNGADKVIINTAAFEIKGFIQEATKIFGSSTIVVSIDVKKNINGQYEVFVCGGKKSTGLKPVDWAKEVEIMGAGEIMITSIDKEGTMEGLDIELIRSISNAVSVPVIASGGVGSLHDYQLGFEKAGANAIAAGSIFYFTDQNPIMTRHYLSRHNINIRV